MGTWKLKEVSFATILNPLSLPLDYSNLNVTFEFKTDSVLIVKGKIMNHPNWSIGSDESILNIREGTHEYCVPEKEVWYYLKIDNEYYNLTVHIMPSSSIEMSIFIIGLGGLSFEKVKE